MRRPLHLEAVTLGIDSYISPSETCHQHKWEAHKYLIFTGTFNYSMHISADRFRNYELCYLEAFDIVLKWHLISCTVKTRAWKSGAGVASAAPTNEGSKFEISNRRKTLFSYKMFIGSLPRTNRNTCLSLCVENGKWNLIEPRTG